MSQNNKQLKTAPNTFWKAFVPLLVTLFLIPLSFIFPLLDSTRAPYFDLTQHVSVAAYWVAQSGGTEGATVIGVLMLLIYISRTGLSATQRWKESVIIVLVIAFFAGVGATLNEHVLKEKLKIPRPNIIWLAGQNGNGPLGLTAEQFYETGDKQARQARLENVLEKRPPPIELSPEIESHWVDETGYSFPSGHAFSALFFATFFLSMAATYLTTQRLWLFYLLLPWAIAVSYSRPILRLHTPTDITVGGLQGLVIGLVAWIVATALIQRFAK